MTAVLKDGSEIAKDTPEPPWTFDSAMRDVLEASDGHPGRLIEREPRRWIVYRRTSNAAVGFGAVSFSAEYRIQPDLLVNADGDRYRSMLERFAERWDRIGEVLAPDAEGALAACVASGLVPDALVGILPKTAPLALSRMQFEELKKAARTTSGSVDLSKSGVTAWRRKNVWIGLCVADLGEQTGEWTFGITAKGREAIGQ